MNSQWVTDNIFQEQTALSHSAAQYMEEVKSVTHNFIKLIHKQVARENNEEADTLSRISYTHPSQVENHVMINNLEA